MNLSIPRLTSIFAFLLYSVCATVAQDGLDPGGEPAYGMQTFAPGFVPRPFSIELFSGGENDVASLGLGENCLGYAASPPDFVAELTESFERITVLADGEVDTTLVVNTPNGSWACNDDTNGLNPALVIHDAAAGPYRIWIGSYGEGASELSTLWISELGPDTLPTTATGPDLTQYPTYGEIALSPGFEPVPVIKQVVGGGRNPVADYVTGDECIGFVAEAPDFSINLTEEFEVIWFSVHSPANMTLLVNSAENGWRCSDDSVLSNPSIGFSDAAVGRYDLWVGSFDQGNYAASLIYVTEFEPDGSLDFTIDTNCPGLLSTRLQVGSSVIVSRSEDEGMPIYAVPNSAASTVFFAENGTLMDIVGGPVCEEAQRWWRIAMADTPRGWIPDGDRSASWLEFARTDTGETVSESE